MFFKRSFWTPPPPPPPMQKSAPEGALIDVRHHLGASNGQAQEAKGKAWV